MLIKLHDLKSTTFAYYTDCSTDLRCDSVNVCIDSGKLTGTKE